MSLEITAIKEFRFWYSGWHPVCVRDNKNWLNYKLIDNFIPDHEYLIRFQIMQFVYPLKWTESSAAEKCESASWDPFIERAVRDRNKL